MTSGNMTSGNMTSCNVTSWYISLHEIWHQELWCQEIWHHEIGHHENDLILNTVPSPSLHNLSCACYCGLGFAQPFSCPTQLQCWGCVVLLLGVWQFLWYPSLHKVNKKWQWYWGTLNSILLLIHKVCTYMSGVFCILYSVPITNLACQYFSLCIGLWKWS